MLFAQKSNRVQPIKDTEIQRFLNLGYDITDETGKILHEAVPEGEIALKTAFIRHRNEIARLNGLVSSLTEEKNQLMEEIEQLKSVKSASAKRTRTTKTEAETAKESAEE